MARIRTIKPEFWSHPVMAKLDDSSRLAAIGLLNFADDEGYFLADPSLVRSSLWPFSDDSTKARRVLQELSGVGYIEVVEHPSRGQVGRVVSFSTHQRVDKPNPSKIKGYFHSESVRGVIQEPSCLEGNGREVLKAKPAPTAPFDFKADLFRKWKEMAGSGGGAFLNSVLRNHKPELRVLEAVEVTLSETRNDPKAYLLGMLKKEKSDSDEVSRLMRIAT